MYDMSVYGWEHWFHRGGVIRPPPGQNRSLYIPALLGLTYIPGLLASDGSFFGRQSIDFEQIDKVLNVQGIFQFCHTHFQTLPGSATFGPWLWLAGTSSWLDRLFWTSTAFRVLWTCRGWNWCGHGHHMVAFLWWEARLSGLGVL